MARGVPGAPDKGVPYRHTRDKIKLLLENGEREWLEEVILKIAEKRPDAVLAALCDLIEGQGKGKA